MGKARVEGVCPPVTLKIVMDKAAEAETELPLLTPEAAGVRVAMAQELVLPELKIAMATVVEAAPACSLVRPATVLVSAQPVSLLLTPVTVTGKAPPAPA